MNQFEGRSFGRLYIPDERDRQFSMRPLMESGRTSRFWITPAPLDQGTTSQCVAYSTCHWLLSSPIKNKDFHKPHSVQHFAELFYKECQRNDQWPGEDYDGTSVRASFKLLKDKGFVSAYHWAWDPETVARHVLDVGPVVVGTDWTNGMMYPDKNFYIKPAGWSVGGHAWTLVGFCRARNAFRMLNSWGKGWGQKGRAWIHFEDLGRLLQSNGEACTAYEVDLDRSLVA